MTRCIDNGKYKFYDSEMELQLELDPFSYAGDFREGVAIVKGSGWRTFGAIDRNGQIVLDTVWSDIKPSIGGYLVAGRRTREYVTEDRGFGEQQYPKLHWYFVESETGNIMDEITFKVIVNVHGFASAEDYQGNTYFINVQKINPGLYDPFMEAITHINRQLVYTNIDTRDNLITYRYLSNNIKAIRHPFNPDPFSKYVFHWFNKSAPLNP